MAKKIKIGVFGGGRGTTMLKVMAQHPDAELVAVCDFSDVALDRCRRLADELDAKVTCYWEFDEFINHDMDAVVVANYGTEHVPFAVRLLDSGRHVTSEVPACQTMAEAVELVEAVERTGKVYTYAENYSYFKGTFEIQTLYKRGDLGEFLHGEGEYVHDCEDIWVGITYGERNHWRNWIPATFYCTHSIGPIVTITGERPTRVTAYETPNVIKRNFGARAADGAVIVCQFSNGAIGKFLPWSNFRREPGSVWYAIYGSKGMAETNRWEGGANRVNVFTREHGKMESYDAQFPFESELSRDIGGHGGSDFYTMQFFLDSILDRPGKEHAIDVYQALDMTLPGTLGYKSIWQGNAAIDIPDLRDPKTRDQYRNDNWCADPKFAGPGQPGSCSFGEVEIPDSLYEAQMREHEEKVRQAKK
jgi:predicted dehydrogenase